MGDTRRGPMERKAPAEKHDDDCGCGLCVKPSFEKAADEALKDEKPGAAEHIEDQSNGDN